MNDINCPKCGHSWYNHPENKDEGCNVGVDKISDSPGCADPWIRCGCLEKQPKDLKKIVGGHWEPGNCEPGHWVDD